MSTVGRSRSWPAVAGGSGHVHRAKGDGAGEYWLQDLVPRVGLGEIEF